MLKVKCSCGCKIHFNNYHMTIPYEPGRVSFSGIKCPNCGKKIAIVGADADTNNINITPKEDGK